MAAEPSELRDRGAERVALSNSRVSELMTAFLRNTGRIAPTKHVYKITGGMGVGGVHDMICYVEEN
jgi:hypothetical protein